MKIPKFLSDQIKKSSARIQKAFNDAIADIRDSVVLDRLIGSIRSGNIDQVLEDLNIREEFFDEMDDALWAAYLEAGRQAARGVPQTVIRFNGRNPRAEAWAAQQSSSLISGDILPSMRDSVRTVLSEGVQAGANPRQTALNIVGRINRATGRREGGILGLTVRQTEYVINARSQLTSGRASDLTDYLTRARRDKRYDRYVAQALRTGDPIPADVVEKMVARYEDRLLAYRGEVIARTETIAALNAGRAEAMTQAIEQGQVKPEDLKKIWRSTGDLKTRDTHRAMEGQEVTVDQPFRSPNGSLMMAPGDTSLGASPAETIQCRCWMEYKIDFLGQIRG